MSKRGKAVVPPLPVGYRDGALPALPLRNTIIHVAAADPYQRVPSGIQPSTLTVERRADGSEHGTVTDREVAELMLTEAHMRDQFADVACIEILNAMSGDEMTPELCHGLRMRLRKLADDVHALTRVGAAHVSQRERVRKHCKVDPVAVCRLVASKVAAGTTTTDAFIEVADETGAAPETIRNAYYKHRKNAGK
jgi:hypothetical protein